MEEPIQIARPYAKAIFAVAQQQNQLQHWAEVLTLLSALTEDKNIAAFLSDQRIAWQQRATLFNQVCANYLDATAVNFIKLLTQNRRLFLITTIAKLYNSMRACAKNMVMADVYSITELSTEQKQKLLVALSKYFTAHVLLNYKIDSSLIGGIKIKIGDRIIDGSIGRQLELLKKTIL